PAPEAGQLRPPLGARAGPHRRAGAGAPPARGAGAPAAGEHEGGRRGDGGAGEQRPGSPARHGPSVPAVPPGPRSGPRHQPRYSGSRRSTNDRTPSLASRVVMFSSWASASSRKAVARSLSSERLSSDLASPSARVGPAARRVAHSAATASSSSAGTTRLTRPSRS